jgi:hypothetical protein
MPLRLINHKWRLERPARRATPCCGEVTIERGGKLVEDLCAGDSFGEMSLIDGAPRSASEVAPITEEAFVSLVHYDAALRAQRHAQPCRSAEAYQ